MNSKTNPDSTDNSSGNRHGLLEHLLELRSRLLRAGAVVIILFIPLAIFADELYSLLSIPLLARLPEGSTLIATQITAPFLVPFRLAFITAIFAAIPYLLYQLWAFISPGLYQQEKRFARPMLVSSVLLFYTGVAFAYFVVIPVMLGFFTTSGPVEAKILPDIGSYLSFMLAIFFAFGCAFEVPVLTVLLVWTGIATPAKLKKSRPYVLIGAFVVGMFLTPPDVVSQTLLSIPIYLLYESGIYMAQLLVPGAREVDEQQQENEKNRQD